MRTLAPLLLLATVAAAQGSSYAGELQAGRQAFDAGKYDEALACFSRAAAINPDDWRGHAYQSLMLIQLAQNTSDNRRREELLGAAERVAGEMVKRGLAEFHDPLYRYVRGLISSIEGDHGRAYATLAEALRAPRTKFAPYDEIDLHGSVQRAFAVTASRVAMRLIAQGQFERAEIELEKVDANLPDADPERGRLERQFAAVSENLGKVDKAIGHLRRCIELSKDDPTAVEELTATIAFIHLVHEEYDKGRAVLAEAPESSRQPDLVAARCTLAVKDALRERGAKLDEALGIVRDAMRASAAENVYRLALLYRDLLLTKVGPREAQTPEGRALLEEAIAIFKREIELRPECPPLYFAVYRCCKLLGDAEQERRYQDLHETRKREFERQDKYDQNGRPRCGN